MIRRAIPSEDRILSDLAMRSKAHWPYPKGYLEKCIDALRVSADDIRFWPVFVAENESTLIGFCALKNVNGENRLDHLWIEPEFIGKGFGSQLLKKPMKRLKSWAGRALDSRPIPMPLDFTKDTGVYKSESFNLESSRIFFFLTLSCTSPRIETST